MGHHYCHVGLVTNLNDSNSQSSVIQFQLAEAEKSKGIDCNLFYQTGIYVCNKAIRKLFRNNK